MRNYSLLLLLALLLCSQSAFSQGGSIRGNVYDKVSGDPIMFATVQLKGEDKGANTDTEGFFSFGNLKAGDYKLVITYVGYDSLAMDIKVKENGIVYQRLFMEESAINLGTVNISARKQKAKTDVQISQVTLTTKQIKSLPSTGGDPDIAQYLPVLPGVISTGDQGGQLFIRGGAPIQNLILLDGMTIYNPFHSIGFFSVFETEAVRSVDVYTGGFNAEYGGRMSAVVDIKTREGNKRRFGGLVSASPFMAKALFEGPIKKLDTEGGGSSSFLITGKQSYIDQTSRTLYSYAENALDTSGVLPYGFRDLYGKMSFLTGNGSKLDLFGFNFTDRVNFSIADLVWRAGGGGANFKLVPPNSNTILGGTIALSTYDIELDEQDESPRQSSINSYAVQLDFTNFGNNNEFKYGFRFTSLSTDFVFRNLLDITIQQQDFNTEIGGFAVFKQKIGDWVFEPSLRIQFYASQGDASLEPRFGAKYNAGENLRFKFAGGFYSQNLLSSVNERDIVNLFVGFLSGPQESLFTPSGERADNNLQRAVHGILGIEVDLSSQLELNVEPYYKGFTQLVNVNRNKLTAQDPDYAIETGEAVGLDVSLRYETEQLYLWSTYSLGKVTRDDGDQVYPTNFDRRHNINFLVSYLFGEKRNWELGMRWNYGSAFPFTQTQGFYSFINILEEGLGTDVLTDNPDLGILYTEELNGGRLVPYHRLDFSLKKNFTLSEFINLDITASVTNAYNRNNIFFIDRRTAERVDQLPILPSLAVQLNFD
jgi:hypothetical protein